MYCVLSDAAMYCASVLYISALKSPPLFSIGMGVPLYTLKSVACDASGIMTRRGCHTQFRRRQLRHSEVSHRMSLYYVGGIANVSLDPPSHVLSQFLVVYSRESFWNQG